MSESYKSCIITVRAIYRQSRKVLGYIEPVGHSGSHHVGSGAYFVEECFVWHSAIDGDEGVTDSMENAINRLKQSAGSGFSGGRIDLKRGGMSTANPKWRL